MPAMSNGRPKSKVRSARAPLVAAFGLMFSVFAAADDLLPAVERDATQRLEAWAHGHGIAGAHVEVSARQPSGAERPCAVAWQVTAAGQPAARWRWSAACPADGRTLSVPLRASVRVQAWKLVRALPQAHRLIVGDVERSQVDVLSLDDAVVTVEPPEGELRQRLPAGAIIRDRHLARTGGVRRGEGVQLMSPGASFRVTVAATALDAGAPGQVIRVRNAASGKMVRATVVGAGVVEAIGGGS